MTEQFVAGSYDGHTSRPARHDPVRGRCPPGHRLGCPELFGRHVVQTGDDLSRTSKSVIASSFDTYDVTGLDIAVYDSAGAHSSDPCISTMLLIFSSSVIGR